MIQELESIAVDLNYLYFTWGQLQIAWDRIGSEQYIDGAHESIRVESLRMKNVCHVSSSR